MLVKIAWVAKSSKILLIIQNLIRCVKPAADSAFKRFVTSMCTDMYLEAILSRVVLSTKDTLKAFFV